MVADIASSTVLVRTTSINNRDQDLGTLFAFQLSKVPYSESSFLPCTKALYIIIYFAHDNFTYIDVLEFPVVIELVYIL